MAKASFLTFIEVRVPDQKTHRYRVLSKINEEELGVIRYHAHWRKFCFYPAQETIFDTDCLYELSTKLDDLGEILKESRKV